MVPPYLSEVLCFCLPSVRNININILAVNALNPDEYLMSALKPIHTHTPAQPYLQSQIFVTHLKGTTRGKYNEKNDFDRAYCYLNVTR